MKRVVIDTGVVVSALLKKEGTSRKAFLHVLATCQLLTSFASLIELEEVLSRPKFKLAFTTKDARAIIELCQAERNN